jgi:hypothetical protein
MSDSATYAFDASAADPHWTPAIVTDGALIVLGATALRFRVFETSSSTETVPQQS